MSKTWPVNVLFFGSLVCSSSCVSETQPLAITDNDRMGEYAYQISKYTQWNHFEVRTSIRDEETIIIVNELPVTPDGAIFFEIDKHGIITEVEQ